MATNYASAMCDVPIDNSPGPIFELVSFTNSELNVLLNDTDRLEGSVAQRLNEDHHWRYGLSDRLIDHCVRQLM